MMLPIDGMQNRESFCLTGSVQGFQHHCGMPSSCVWYEALGCVRTVFFSVGVKSIIISARYLPRGRGVYCKTLWMKDCKSGRPLNFAAKPDCFTTIKVAVANLKKVLWSAPDEIEVNSV